MVVLAELRMGPRAHTTALPSGTGSDSGTRQGEGGKGRDALPSPTLHPTPTGTGRCASRLGWQQPFPAEPRTPREPRRVGSEPAQLPPCISLPLGGQPRVLPPSRPPAMGWLGSPQHLPPTAAGGDGHPPTREPAGRPRLSQPRGARWMTAKSAGGIRN